ncbi:MAG: STAS domain-containing protein [Planctomycetes bacterium]|nr:STAS domain-containing protein [Planctomycetota bacterium]
MINPIRAIEQRGRTLVVSIAGDVDVHRSSAFQRSLMELLDRRPRQIVLDLGDVPYMDSAGLAGLIKLLGHVRRLDIDLWLCRPTDAVRSLLEITRLDTVFQVSQSLEEVVS